MYVVMGATGNVGGAVADALIEQGEEVTVLTRHPESADHWRDKGAQVAQADADDVESLRTAFRAGKRAFLLNPPADPTGDSDTAERRTIGNILAALEGSGLEKVVAASTYGAQQGEPAGDLTTLWRLEEGLRKQPIPAAINRGAYYMTNWTGMADMVRQSGKLPSLFPAGMKIPMVAPRDLGEAAAARLVSPVSDTDLRFVEGPETYSPRQVAEAFGRALGSAVELDVAPREAWRNIFEAMGFSDAAARSYERMVAISVDGDFEKPATPLRGRTTLDAFLKAALGG